MFKLSLLSNQFSVHLEDNTEDEHRLFNKVYKRCKHVLVYNYKMIIHEFFNFFTSYVCVFFLNVYLYTSCVQGPQKPKEGIGFSGTVVTDGFKPYCMLGIKPRSHGRAANAPNC